MLSRGSRLKLGLTYWVSATAVFGIVGWSSVTVIGMQQDLSQAEKDRAALSQQVKDLGGTPVAGPRGTTGKPGIPGRDGRTGDPGPSGQRGADGRDGTAGVAGSDGRDGSNGADGAAGKDGADGRDGVDGQDGAVGPQGEKGDTGEPGPTCPSGYSPTTAVVNDKDVVVCARTSILRG